MTASDIDVVKSFGSIVEDLPQSVEHDGNMQGTLENALRDVMSEPLVDMEFGSFDEVVQLYRKYAYSKGFAYMIINSRKIKSLWRRLISI